MTNYVCAICGGRWLPKTSTEPLPTICPWCEVERLRAELATTKLNYEQHVNDERSAVRTAMGLVENAARELPGPRADEWLQVLAVLKRAMELDAAKTEGAPDEINRLRAFVLADYERYDPTHPYAWQLARQFPWLVEGDEKEGGGE